MAGRQALALLVGVRLLLSQPLALKPRSYLGWRVRILRSPTGDYCIGFPGDLPIRHGAAPGLKASSD